MEPKLVRNLHFAKKHNKKGLKMNQTTNPRALSVGAETSRPLSSLIESSSGSWRQLNPLGYTLSSPSSGRMLLPARPGVLACPSQTPRHKARPHHHQEQEQGNYPNHTSGQRLGPLLYPHMSSCQQKPDGNSFVCQTQHMLCLGCGRHEAGVSLCCFHK